MNIRRIPLDNLFNAFCKRAMDIVGSFLLLFLTSPIMLICAIGVRLSSPGPIIFAQEWVGRNQKPFYMYKFRSMRVNDRKIGWSTNDDDRKTRFGSFIRKFSLDEFPQFWHVLKGKMSLVAPARSFPILSISSRGIIWSSTRCATVLPAGPRSTTSEETQLLKRGSSMTCTTLNTGVFS